MSTQGKGRRAKGANKSSDAGNEGLVPGRSQNQRKRVPSRKRQAAESNFSENEGSVPGGSNQQRGHKASKQAQAEDSTLARKRPQRKSSKKADPKTPARKRHQSETTAQRQPNHGETSEEESDGDDRSGTSSSDSEDEEKGRICFSIPDNINATFSDDMEVFVTQKEKMKIWKGRFANLHTFLPQVHGVNQNAQVLLNDKGRVITQHEQKEINSIEEWTRAFLNFALTYCERHGDRYRELMIYMKIIHFAADHFVGYGWRTYDIMFRLTMVKNPERAWGSIDHNLWALYVTSPTLVKSNGASYRGTGQNFGMRGKRGNFRPSQRTAPPQTQKTPHGSYGAPRPRTCRFFNEGLCTFGSTCKFPHKCAKCGAGHPATGCK